MPADTSPTRADPGAECLKGWVRMVDERAAEQPALRSARLLTLTALVIVIMGAETLPAAGANTAVFAPRSTASMWHDHGGSNGPVHDSTGNGSHNRNEVSINSPTFNHGIQHITNTNVSGSTSTQASFCKKRFRFCRIHQRMVVLDP
jgi:hypothetical protein